MAPVTHPAASRGRPREFDADEVLERAIGLFWQRGFEAASMAEIVDATGLNKSSIYNAFGSKDELFSQALEHYTERRLAMMDELLNSGEGRLADLEIVFQMMEMELRGDVGRFGCLAVTAGAELGPHDERIAAATIDFRRRLRASIRRFFERVSENGEIDADDVPTFTELVIAFITSTSSLARGGADATEMAMQFAAVRALVDSWSAS